MPAPFAPMLAGYGEPAERNVVAEPKRDGFRALVEVTDGEVAIWSRRGSNLTAKFPEVVAGIRVQRRRVVLDGELVCLDDNGLPDLTDLARRSERLGARNARPATFVPFDICVDGVELFSQPWSDRRRRLEARCAKAGLAPTPVFEDVAAAWSAVRTLGLEGLVVKRTDGTYLPGRRSPSWVKVKHTCIELLTVVGVTRTSRSAAALIVASRRSEGTLVYRGVVEAAVREAGKRRIVQSLLRCRTEHSPLAAPPNFKHPIWVEPALVVEVRHLPSKGRLREPVLLGPAYVDEHFHRR